jgi:predicted Zn-dependent protease
MRSLANASARRWSAVLLSAVAALGCVQDDGERLSAKDLFIPSYSDDDLRQLGMDADRAIQKQVRIIDDPLVLGFVNTLGQQLVEEIEPQPFVYRFRVIEAPTLNAFALPGGYIYIHSETLQRVSSIDELAGILGHEIAHVHARHFSRREEQTALPGLAAQVLGMAAAVAAGDSTPALAGAGLNVALKITFTREFEAEADKLGSIWVSRAGYQPDAIKRFLQKIIASGSRFPDSLPPYLASHPFPEVRIAAIEDTAESLQPLHAPEPALDLELKDAQNRLALLLGTRRSKLTKGIPPPDPANTPVLAEARRLAAEGEIDRALVALGRIDDAEGLDPRVPFLIAELLLQSGQTDAAIRQFQRTLAIDPSRAQVFYQLGLAFKANEEHHRAVYAMEQALLRAGDRSELRRRIEWEIFKLTFARLEDAGFADGSDGEAAGTPVGVAVANFASDAGRFAWWARIGSRFEPYADKLRVRWIDPRGRVAQEDPADEAGRRIITSVLAFDDTGPREPGDWKVELLLNEERIALRSVRVN